MPIRDVPGVAPPAAMQPFRLRIVDSRKMLKLLFRLIAIALLVGAAWLVMIVYDIPVRKYLSDKRYEKAAKKQITQV